jgi:hypothetical protein
VNKIQEMRSILQGHTQTVSGRVLGTRLSQVRVTAYSAREHEVNGWILEFL